MPDASLTLINQQVGIDHWLGEFLLLPELSTLASSPDVAWNTLRNLAEKFLADVPPAELCQRTAPPTVEPLSVSLDLDPPKRIAADAGPWREALTLTFHGVKWKRPEGTWLAYIPLLSAAAVAPKSSELKEALEREIRFAIQRKLTDDSANLRAIVMLSRVENLILEPTPIPLHLKSPKTRQREGSEEKPESSTLQEAATDMTKREPPKTFELADTVTSIAEALAGRSARSVLLVGPSGCGKTAAVHELVRTAHRLGLSDRPFYETSGSRLIMGALGYGMWQERCHKFCREAAHTRSIVYLGNLIELLEIGKSESNAIGIAGQLRAYMQRGELLAISECTPEQVGVLEREDPHLLAAVRQITLEEPSAAKQRAILQQVSAEITAGDARKRGKDLEQKPVLATGTLDELQRLHRRYASYSGAPGRAIRFLKNLVKDNEGRNFEPGQTITPSHVTAAFARETGLPLLLLDEALPLDADETRAWFASRVLAQDLAVSSVIDVLATVKASLNRPRRPIASLLFIGPTGVGKTEMAKALAEYFFSDRARLTRFDMSEYQNASAVTRLVGGWGKEGLLTARVRQQPFSVLLLDEVEKAHASFFDLMLQVLGEGRLTDAAGRTADFSNAIVIMTSNLGAASFGKGGFGLGKSKKPDAGAHFVEEVRAFLRPELFNRIDRIVPFLPLDASAIAQVARREVDMVQSRDGLRLRQITLDLGEPAVKQLATHGFDPAYGARPLKRAIERELLAPLADALNQYSESVPLKAAVSIESDKLHVRVRAETAGLPITTLGPAIAQRATRLRRQLQRLVKSGSMLQVQNELFQLQRKIERAELRRKLTEPDLPAWRDRLKRLKLPADAVNLLVAETVAAEEESLLAFYERLESAPNKDWLTPLDALESRLWQTLSHLFALRYPNPDRISIGIFSDKEARVLDLARAYFALAQSRGYEALLAWYKHEARGMVRYREDSAKKYLADPTGSPRGIVLEIRGPHSVLLFHPEAGWHIFDQQGKLANCWVLVGQCSLADLETPPEPRVPIPPSGFERRSVDLTAKTALEPYYQRPEQFTRLDDQIARSMERRLRQLISEPISEET